MRLAKQARGYGDVGVLLVRDPRLVVLHDAREQPLERAEINLRRLNEGEQYKQKTIATADGELAQAKVNADGYFEQKKALATGILAEGRNNAEAIRKEREAMNSGGRTLVEMEAARQLEGKPTRMIPYCEGNGSLQIQSFDVNTYLQTKGLQGVGAQKSGGN